MHLFEYRKIWVWKVERVALYHRFVDLRFQSFGFRIYAFLNALAENMLTFLVKIG